MSLYREDSLTNSCFGYVLQKIALFIQLLVRKGWDFGITHLAFILENPKSPEDESVEKHLAKRRGMKSSKKWEPLLQGGIAPRSWIILPPRIEESFLERWSSALSENAEVHMAMCKFDEHWERDVAVTDLNHNCSMFAQHEYPFGVQPHLYFQLFLWRELRTYGLHLNRVVETNRVFRECSEILRTAHSQSQRAVSRTRLEHDLGAILEGLLDLRLCVSEFEKDYWDKVFCVGSFTDKYVPGWESDIQKFPTMRRLTDSLCPPLVRQERNLDSVFQVRVGDLLREYAPNPYGKRLSLLTISRLVLLVYICAELAIDIDGDLIIWGSDPPRKLSVDRTYETLRDAGLR
jgi:hypothetical protein